MQRGVVSDLQSMLSGMDPVLHDEGYHFISDADPALASKAFAMIRETEGVAWVIPSDAQADSARQFARITLQVHSDLEGVGLTAAVATALSAEGVACNVIAGFHHDHLFVSWHRREQALAILKQLSEDARP